MLARRQPDLTVCMEQVHKPHNVSAIIRTADAVGVHEVHAVWPGSRMRTMASAAAGSNSWVQVKTHRTIGDAVAHLKGQGMQILAGQNAGAGKFDRVGKGLAAAIRIIAAYSVFCAAVLILLGKALMGFFTSTPITIEIGYAYLFITAVGVFFCGVVFTVRYTLNGAGDASASAILSVVELVVRVVCAYGFSHFTPLGYIGIFLGTPCGWLASSIVGVARYKGGKWKLKRIVKQN